MARVLLVDDDPDFVNAACRILGRHGHEVRTAASLADARSALAAAHPDVLLLDLMLPDGSGLELLSEDAGSVANRIVLITGHPGVKSQIRALGGPCVSYLTKPFDRAELLSLCRDDPRSDTDPPEVRLHLGSLIGDSPQMQELCSLIKKVAATDSPVLIVGETGTGKELIAEAVHRESGRQGAFVAVNCGSLSRELAGSELFGHEKGSFTGAMRRHVGYFQRADRGTLFLDEVTEMPIDLQPHFLRVLETSRVLPVGAERETRVDARIVAATNREPKDAIADKCLREDLYFRLGVFPLRLPPLRERQDDIALLAEHFAEELQKESVKTRKLSQAALAALKAYPWPGNVRELRHVIHRAVLFSDPNAEELELPGAIESPFPSLASHERIQVGRSIRDVERELIVSTLEHLNGDKRATADMLGISLKTLYNRLNEFRHESVPDEPGKSTAGRVDSVL